MSGKSDRHDWLRGLGASDVIAREAVRDSSDKALLRTRWAGAIDTVGGTTLSTILRTLEHRGCVAACGLVGGSDLPATVYPFILRGVTLDGIDSAMCPRDERLAIWSKLAGQWKLEGLEDVATDLSLEQVDGAVQSMLSGGATGRFIVHPSAAPDASC